jgi:hypothetical protein
MSNTTRRPSRAQKPVAAPFSATAARLIEQIQADARAQLLADLSAKDAIVVLHGFDAESKRVIDHGYSITIFDGKGNGTNFYRRHTEPESWIGQPHMAGVWHPARWEGSQTLVDANGVEWKRDLPTMVCNDFGTLVEVAV